MFHLAGLCTAGCGDCGLAEANAQFSDDHFCMQGMTVVELG